MPDLSPSRIRWWVIAVVAALPPGQADRQASVAGPYQRILAAVVQLYLVCPPYSRMCQQSLQSLANMINTARLHVLAGCPDTLEFQAFTMPPTPSTSSLPEAFYGMRALVLHGGSRLILRVVSTGLRELSHVLELLDHTVIDGVHDVLRDVLGFAEDVVHMCQYNMQHKPAVHRSGVARSQQTRDRPQQTPDVSWA